MKRRQLLAGASAAVALATAGCTSSGSDSPSTNTTSSSTPTSTSTDTPTDAAPSTNETTETETPTTSAGPGSAVDVTGTDAARGGDGTLTIEYRPVTLQAFTWDGADGQFYEDEPAERYLIVQLRLVADGGALDVDLRNLEATIDGEALGRQAFTGELKVSSPVEPEAPVSGWRAWSIPESVDDVALRHTADSRAYSTTFEHAGDLDLGVSAYDQ
jgi:hypothetical protein